MAEQKDVMNLIKLAQNGSSEAFGQLVEKHERFVYNIAFRMLPNSEDAKDISQEVFIKAYRYLQRFDGKAAFSTWLYRITVNTCIDEIRKRKGKETISIENEFDDGESSKKNQFADKSISVEDEIISREGLDSIKKAINKLGEEHKTIIVLRDIQGLSYTEISEITETSMGTVKSRLARARKALKDLISLEREQKKITCVK